MSSEPVVRTQGLSKLYRIGGPRERYPTLRDAMSSAVGKLRRNGSAATGEDFWALRDVDLEIGAGEVVALVGRNGAGKTTLMRILSRITAPTEGWAEIRGRVGSLLEVGTGFHPELTGRENIELNGAILGMRRAEIRGRFDEIIAFAEIDQFLDTPVKHYSSGMYVRLAFAVAAHLEPELLMVDEVLAVGDAAFQRKCLAKMGEVAGEGRTVIVVSHNMAVVQALCERAVFLERGRVVDDGATEDIVSSYLRSLETSATQHLLDRERSAVAWHDVMLESLAVRGDGNEAVATGRPVRFEFGLKGRGSRLGVNFVVHDELGLPVARFDSSLPGPDDRQVLDDLGAVCEIDELPLLPGRYRLDVRIWADNHLQDELEGAAFFDVVPGLIRGRPIAEREAGANVAVPHRWLMPR